MQCVRVWDLPTRIFHWSLVICVAVLVATGSIGGNIMTWHLRAGYAVLVLLLFRLVWGMVGGYWSRFATFVPTPDRLRAYVSGARANDEPALGHSPLGALSVLAMLSVLGAQVATGLVSDDEIAFAGPLVAFASSATTSLATVYHKEYGKLLLLALVALHVGANVFYQQVKKRRLVTAMLTGDRTVGAHERATPSADHLAHRLMAMGVLSGCVAIVAWLASLGG